MQKVDIEASFIKCNENCGLPDLFTDYQIRHLGNPSGLPEILLKIDPCTQTLSTTFTNNFCACQSSSFTDIRLICSVFVEFITSFFHVLTYFNGCMAAMDARLGFGTRLRWFCDRFVTVGFGENEHFAVALDSGSDVD